MLNREAMAEFMFLLMWFVAFADRCQMKTGVNKKKRVFQNYTNHFWLLCGSWLVLCLSHLHIQTNWVPSWLTCNRTLSTWETDLLWLVRKLQWKKSINRSYIYYVLAFHGIFLSIYLFLFLYCVRMLYIIELCSWKRKVSILGIEPGALFMQSMHSDLHPPVSAANPNNSIL